MLKTRKDHLKFIQTKQVGVVYTLAKHFKCEIEKNDNKYVIIQVTDKGNLLIIPEEDIQEVTEHVHSFLLLHEGAQGVYDYLKERVTGITMKYVRNIVDSCQFCKNIVNSPLKGPVRVSKRKSFTTQSKHEIQKFIRHITTGVPMPKLVVIVKGNNDSTIRHLLMTLIGSKCPIIVPLNSGNTPGAEIAGIVAQMGWKPSKIITREFGSKEELEEIRNYSRLLTGKPLKVVPETHSKKIHQEIGNDRSWFPKKGISAF